MGKFKQVWASLDKFGQVRTRQQIRKMEKKGTKILVVSEKEKVRSKDKRKTRLNSNGRPVSKIGKIRVQNWKSDPMNSPKAFGELKKK